MTTYVNSIDLQHTTDTEFNQWVVAFVAGLTAIGLVQTADTGQTSFGSPEIARPGMGAKAGFQVWRFDDAIHAAGDPIIMRFDFGTSSDATTRPGIDFDVGTTTDGAGTITGSLADTMELETGMAPSSQGTGPIFMVHAEGFFGVYFSKGGPNPGSHPDVAWLTGFVCRSCDAAGVPNNEAFFVTTQQGNTGVNTAMEQNPIHQSVDYSSGNQYGTTITGQTIQSPFGFLPGGDDVRSYVDDDGNIAVFPAFGINPHPFPMPQLVFGWQSDVPENLTFTATVVGVTQRTYIAQPGRLLGFSGPVCVPEAELDEYIMGFMWE